MLHLANLLTKLLTNAVLGCIHVLF